MTWCPDPDEPDHPPLWVKWTVVLIILAILYTLFTTTKAWTQEIIPLTEWEREDIKRWVSPSCCRTNDCCFKVRPDALTLVPKSREFSLKNEGEQVRINITGEVRDRTGWSELDLPLRCACDHHDDTKQWVVTPYSNTRCIFPKPSGS